MKKGKSASGSKKKTKSVVRAPRPAPAPRAKKNPRKAPEIRRAIPLDYVTTGEVTLRAAPDLASAKISGGQLSKGAIVKIAPQDWWYVEIESPATASGVLRGWVSNASLRRATEIDLAAAPPVPSAPLPATPVVVTPADPAHRAELRKKMAESIVQFEGRRDAQGHLRVYILPAGDGGGRYEVAGINDRYHPHEAARLRELIDAGRFGEAEEYATEVIAEYTDVVAKWTSVPSIEAYLRDCAFNRGPGGAAKILQMALGVHVDGGVGPETLAALCEAEKDPPKLLAALRVARENYELRVAGRREKFWKGLVNRWDNSRDFASQLA
jgi:hypothetical protein